jgi:hypothetical protein
MANFPTSNNSEKYRKSICEELLIKKRFPSFDCRIRGRKLICRGKLKPTENSTEYRIEVSYEPWGNPDVRILNPKIKPEKDLHFYKTGNLCLYDWREQPWQDKWHLADTIIPWTAEWLMYYEIYLLTGKWLGKSAIHGDATKAAEPQPETENSLAAWLQ